MELAEYDGSMSMRLSSEDFKQLIKEKKIYFGMGLDEFYNLIASFKTGLFNKLSGGNRNWRDNIYIYGNVYFEFERLSTAVKCWPRLLKVTEKLL
jgi:hypothetical protein